MKERWKSIKGYDGLYEVSDMGRVRSFHFGKVKVLKTGLRKNGYYCVQLRKNGKMKDFYVHRLVVETFIGPIPKGMVVNHLNENKLDNRLENLEVVTYKENINHGTRNERAGKSISKANKISLLGNTNGNKQLKLTHAKSCAKYTFSSSSEASVFFGYKHKCRIGSLISVYRKRGKNWISIKGEKYYFSQNTE